MNTATLIYSHAYRAVAGLGNNQEEKPHFINLQKARTHKEVFSKLLDKLSIHYDVDMHKLVKL